MKESKNVKEFYTDALELLQSVGIKVEQVQTPGVIRTAHRLKKAYDQGISDRMDGGHKRNLVVPLGTLIVSFIVILISLNGIIQMAKPSNKFQNSEQAQNIGYMQR